VYRIKKHEKKVKVPKAVEPYTQREQFYMVLPFMPLTFCIEGLGKSRRPEMLVPCPRFEPGSFEMQGSHVIFMPLKYA
jgi:hypothetical protein